MPPGQRLILYVLAAFLLVLSTGAFRSGEAPVAEEGRQPPGKPLALPPPFRMGKELVDLKTALATQAGQPRLRLGLFAVQPQTGRYVDICGHESFAAASMIKVPVLVALLSALDRRQVRLDQQLTLRQDLVGGGSGFLQWRPVGSQVSLKDAAELMIINSDNTATNLIIDLLGGTEALNKQFASWGLTETRFAELMPDFPGLNKTSPYELSYLLGLVDSGELLSADSRMFMFKIMERTKTRTLLPQGLGLGARIAHKTGDIGMMVGDAGVVTAPSGVKYLIVAQVERPHNDRRANELVRVLSRAVYAAFVPDATFAPAGGPVASARVHHHRRRGRHHV